MEAIVSATRTAADLLNEWEDLGSIGVNSERRGDLKSTQRVDKRLDAGCPYC